MRREPTIPLFLWVATAVLTHLAGYTSADRVTTLVERAHELRHFMDSVRREFAGSSPTFEVSLDDSKPPEEAPLAPEPPPEAPKALPEPEPEPPKVEPPKPKPEVKPTPPKVAELALKPEKPIPAKPGEQKPPLELPPVDQRRIAVKQHVEDKNQPDNPNAPLIGDEANHVKEQTQARITSTTQDDEKPNPGTNQAKPSPEPGNGDENRVAQDQDRPGERRAPEPEPGREPVAVATPPQTAPAEQRQNPQPRPAEAPERPAAPALPGMEGRPDVVSGANGTWEQNKGRQAQAPRPRQKHLPPRPHSDSLFGFGSQLLSQNGVNLNLTPQAAVAAIGRDRLVRERVADGERRRSTHKGSFKTAGIERWRAAIENYVPSVKIGNQTALDTARVPFASYLNQIHNRIHPIFADQFLDSLDSLPAAHPMNQNRERMFTSLELVLDRQEGRIVRMGVTKTSGVTAFDVGALESVNRAAPFGPPPEAILSPDGNVYLHWEFHREPMYACSTFFAHPFMLKGNPRSVPPKLESPPKDQKPPREQGQFGQAPARHATAAEPRRP
jgi:hypothetical protein